MKIVYLTDKALSEGIKTYQVVEICGTNILLVSNDGKYKVIPVDADYIYYDRNDAIRVMSEMVRQEKKRLTTEMMRIDTLLISELDKKDQQDAQS